MTSAYQYLELVKSTYKNQPRVYEQFLEIMKSFKEDRLSSNVVIAKVSELFKDHMNLLEGFQLFIPANNNNNNTNNPNNTNNVNNNNANNNNNTSNLPNNSSGMTGAVAAGSNNEEKNNNGLSQATIAALTHATSTLNTTVGGVPVNLAIPPPPSQQRRNLMTGYHSNTAQAQLAGAVSSAATLPGQSNAVMNSNSGAGAGNSGPFRNIDTVHSNGNPNPTPGNTGSISNLTALSGANAITGNGLNGHNSHINEPSAATASTVLGQTRADEDFQKAIKYVTDIRNRFSHKPDVYQQFLHLLQMYQQAHSTKSSCDEQSVTTQIRDLFRSHPDLYRQFSYFLRNSSGIRAMGLTNSVMHAALSSATNANGNVSTTTPSGNTASNTNINSSNTVGNRGIIGANSNINNNANNTNNSNTTFVSNPPASISDIHPVGQAAVLAQAALASTSGRVLPHGSHVNIPTGSGLKSTGVGSSGGTTTSNIPPPQVGPLITGPPAAKRMRLNNGTVFAPLNQSPAQLPQNHDMSEDYNTLPHKTVRKNESGSDNLVSPKHHKYGLQIFNNLEMKIPKALFNQILEIGNLHGLGQYDFNTMVDKVCDILNKAKYEDLANEVRSQLNKHPPNMYAWRESERDFYRYMMNNSLLKQLDKEHASYRRLPDYVVQPRCSGRTPLAYEVLNHSYVSKPTGHEGAEKEDNGVQLKNQFKEQLHRNEDDMFELDLMIETNRSARRRLEQLFNSYSSNIRLNVPMYQFKLDLPEVEKRSITRLFGDSGKKVLSMLQKTPQIAIPIVLKRLHEKEKDWMNLRAEMRPVWYTQAMYKYYRAHDYRFTVFKAAETRRLQPKNLIYQMKERHMRRKRDPNHGFMDPKAESEMIKRSDVVLSTDKAGSVQESFLSTTSPVFLPQSLKPQEGKDALRDFSKSPSLKSHTRKETSDNDIEMTEQNATTAVDTTHSTTAPSTSAVPAIAIETPKDGIATQINTTTNPNLPVENNPPVPENSDLNPNTTIKSTPEDNKPQPMGIDTNVNADTDTKKDENPSDNVEKSQNKERSDGNNRETNNENVIPPTGEESQESTTINEQQQQQQQPEEEEDEDDDDDDDDDDEYELTPDASNTSLQNNEINHSSNVNRPLTRLQLEFDPSLSAVMNQPPIVSGVVDGVGVINSNIILQQMVAPLNAERGSLQRTHITSIDRHDMRFLMSNEQTLGDAMEVILGYARNEILNSEKPAFIELWRCLYCDMFRVRLSEESVTSFMSNSASPENSDKQEEDKDKVSEPEALMSLLDTKEHPQLEIELQSALSKLEEKKHESNLALKHILPEENLSYEIVLGNEFYYLFYRCIQKIHARLEYGRYCSTLDYTLRRTQTEEEKKQKYQDLLKIIIKQFSLGKREDRFEDSIRQLLGLQGYQLFSVPKIVELVSNHMRTIWENTSKAHEYLILYKFMSQKLKSAKTSQEQRQLFEAYYIMAGKISGSQHDLYCFQFYPVNHVFGISLVDKEIYLLKPFEDDRGEISDKEIQKERRGK